jgi:hypothetical protein
MRNPVSAAVTTIAAAAAWFFVHKPIADHIDQWVGEHMAGQPDVKRPPYGLEVVLPATLSSIEYGMAMFVLYGLVRRAAPTLSPLARALCVFLLSLAVGGQLLRFPVMQLVIGNPLWVTLVQHAGGWLPYLAASLVVAFSYEALLRIWPDPSAAGTSSVHRADIER